MNIDNNTMIKINEKLGVKIADYEEGKESLVILQYYNKTMNLDNYKLRLNETLSILFLLREKSLLLTNLLNKIISNNAGKNNGELDITFESLTQVIASSDAIYDHISSNIFDLIEIMIRVQNGNLPFEYLEREMQSLLHNNVNKLNVYLNVIEFNILSNPNYNDCYLEYLENNNMPIKSSDLFDIISSLERRLISDQNSAVVLSKASVDDINPFNFEEEMQDELLKNEDLKKRWANEEATLNLFLQTYSYLINKKNPTRKRL